MTETSSAIDDVPINSLRKVFDEQLKNSSEANYQLAECAMCFEEAPLICLSDRCKFAANSFERYTSRMIKSPQIIILSPASCFHPRCNQLVQFGQLEKHGLFATQKWDKAAPRDVCVAQDRNYPWNEDRSLPYLRFSTRCNQIRQRQEDGCNSCKTCTQFQWKEQEWCLRLTTDGQSFQTAKFSFLNLAVAITGHVFIVIWNFLAGTIPDLGGRQRLNQHGCIKYILTYLSSN